MTRLDRPSPSTRTGADTGDTNDDGGGARRRGARGPAGDPSATLASTRAAIERSKVRYRETVDVLERIAPLVRR